MTTGGSENAEHTSTPAQQYNATDQPSNDNTSPNDEIMVALPSSPSQPLPSPAGPTSSTSAAGSTAQMIAEQPQLTRVRSRTGVEDQLEMFSWSDKPDTEGGSVSPASQSVNSRSYLWSTSKEKYKEGDDVESQSSGAGSSAENSPIEEVRACVPGMFTSIAIVILILISSVCNQRFVKHTSFISSYPCSHG